MDIEDIARVCHEANRVYCLSLEDDSQAYWEFAPAWQKESAIHGVRFHQETPDADGAASHFNWMAKKMFEGWVYGVQKDEKAKTHPCILPFEKLPVEQQRKDQLFRAIVHALK